MKLKTYPKYKSSGIEWLGEIPYDWELLRLKRITRFDYGDSLPSGDRGLGEFNVYGSNGVVGQHDETNAFGPCLIIGRKGSFGKVKYSQEPCFAIDTTYFVDQRSTKNDLRWLYYCLKWLQLDAFTKDSAVPGLSREDAYENLIPFCSEDEQRAIALFLDRETARIDELIGKKKDQINLLREKRTALISQAVIKGLDPTVPMKDSGIEWLGKIPEHWEVRKLKYAALTKFSCADKKVVDGEESVLLCNYVDVYKNDIISKNMDFMEATATREEIKRFKLMAGDVIVTKDSESWEDIAIPAYLPEGLDGVICGYHLAIIRSKNGLVDGKFLFRSLYARGINDQYRVAANGITRYGLGKYHLDNSLVLLPSIDEQRKIAAFLDRETAKIDALIAKINEGIEKLKEYRTALISAAVTGKIDVRKGNKKINLRG